VEWLVMPTSVSEYKGYGIQFALCIGNTTWAVMMPSGDPVITY